MFGRGKHTAPAGANEIGLLGVDSRFEGSIRFRGTLRIDGVVAGNIVSEPGSGSVLIVNRQAVVTGDIVSDSVLISGKVEGNVRARERVEIFRSGHLRGDIHTGDIMIEGGAEFDGYCHMIDGDSAGARDALPAEPKTSGSQGGRRLTDAARSEEAEEPATA